MPLSDNNTQAFLALVRAGLWEDLKFKVEGLKFKDSEGVDWNAVLRLAEEQAVVGLVTAGLERVTDSKVPQDDVFQFVGATLQLEQRNRELNEFVARLIDDLRRADVYALLVKGQGVAQCYERPLWRTSGDVDLLLSGENYRKAQSFLIPMADSVEKESGTHQGMNIDPWVVELHGNQHCGLSARMDRVIDEIQKDCFCGGKVRSWMNGKTQVFLPSADNDVIIIFTHFLKHFYKGGLGLRQICDWCRLLWTYRDSIDTRLLEKRLRKAGLVSEWKAFGAFATDVLGMPADAMPLYDASERWKRKAKRIRRFILMSGNFGHNRDNSFRKCPYIIRKAYSMGRRIGDAANHARIFPLDSIRFLPRIVLNGLRSAMRGE